MARFKNGLLISDADLDAFGLGNPMASADRVDELGDQVVLCEQYNGISCFKCPEFMSGLGSVANACAGVQLAEELRKGVANSMSLEDFVASSDHV